jgi:hypothetical protein
MDPTNRLHAKSNEHTRVRTVYNPDPTGWIPEEASARIADRNMRKPGLFDWDALRSMESKVGEKAVTRGGTLK